MTYKCAVYKITFQMEDSMIRPERTTILMAANDTAINVT